MGSNPTADMSFVPERRASPGALPSSCRKVENDPPTAFPRAQRGRSLRTCRGTGSRGGDCLARGAFNPQPNRQSVTSLLLRSRIPSPWQVLPRQTGYSSVGRASDCRMLQQSDGPWFDSGWPDFLGSVECLKEGTMFKRGNYGSLVPAVSCGRVM